MNKTAVGLAASLASTAAILAIIPTAPWLTITLWAFIVIEIVAIVVTLKGGRRA